MASNESLAFGASAADPEAREWLRSALGLAASQAPFPWQLELLRRFRQGQVVSSLDIPTGLGKTAVMAVWLVARALGAVLPRRLVYVVDRRAVVDQATEVAESLCAWVATDQRVADALGLDGRALPISTLRGQHVDNRAWLEDPSSPALVVGTVDMVGSRLLFSGYGVSPKMRPYHAGLLGADTLVVLDEAHLVPAFEDLLRQVERAGASFGPSEPSLCALVPAFKLLSLSATGRHTDATSLTISDDDRRDPIVSKRLHAKKTLSVVKLAELAEPVATTDASETGSDDAADLTKKIKAPKLAGVLANRAWELTSQGTAPVRCLIFCHSREDANTVATELRNLASSIRATEPTIELLVGGRRVRERIGARDALARLGFLAGTAVSLERAAFLIATSAGEVGVDLDADHMVCDLVAWERTVQRLGRVNRRGDGDAKVLVVVDSEPAPSSSAMKSLSKRDASDAAKEQLAERTKRLNALQDAKVSGPKGQKRSADSKAAEEKRKQQERELKKDISACQQRIKAFKDADAKVVASHEAAVGQYRALQRLLAAVGEGGNLSPDSLLALRSRKDLVDSFRAATTVAPLRPELTRPLVDAWSMTSLDDHPGRPDVDPWLRGFRPNDPPQTTVVWRRHLPVRADGPFEPKAAKRFFEAAPPHTSEQLETETRRVLEWLIERAATVSDTKGEGMPNGKQVVIIALGPRGELRGWRALEQLAAVKSKGKSESKEAKKSREQEAKELETLLVGATIVVDARLGGLSDGLLQEDNNTLVDVADDASTTWLTRPDAAEVPVTGFRIRALGSDDEDESAWRTGSEGGWVRRHLFVRSMVDGEPSTALVIDGWAGDAETEEERAEANRPQPLDEHQSWAAESARLIARRLGFDRAREDLLALAARLHDEGKRAARWQRAFNAPKDGRFYAKTKGPIDFDLLDGYRHELGSLRNVEDDSAFKALGTDDQELVFHLVAAHHGFARPVIGTNGCDDAPPSVVDERARAVALRFARLTRCWGPWGLAWWETLLRAADQIASRRNQQAAVAQREPE